LRLRLTSQFGLNKTNYAVLAIFSIISSHTSIGKSSIPNILSIVFISNSVAIFMCWIWFELADRLLFRKFLNSNLLVFIFAFVLGVTKGGVTGYMIWLFTDEGDITQSVASRLPAAIFLACTVIPLVEYLESTRLKYEAARQNLVSAEVRLAINEGRSSAASSGRVDSLIQVLTELQSQISGPAGSAGNYPNLMRAVIDNSVRPASHELWTMATKKYRSFSLKSLTRLTLSNQLYSLPWLCAVYLAASVLTLLPLIGLTNSILRSLFGTMVVAFVFSLSKEIHRLAHIRRQRWLFELITVAIASYFVITLSNLLLGDVAELAALTTGFAIGLLLLELRFFFGIVANAKNNHDDIQSQIRELVNRGEIVTDTNAAIETLQNRRLANLLHGEVQNRLLAAALRFESNEGSTQDLLLELENVVAKLTEHPKLDKDSNLTEIFADLKSRWNGFIHIDFQGFYSLKNSLISFEMVLQLVFEEIITNSVRHGLADSLTIFLDHLEVDQLELRAVDNGIGLTKGRPGMGSQLFETVSNGHWSMENQPNGGLVLKLRLAQD
jgi:signal transduction histidine kinase